MYSDDLVGVVDGLLYGVAESSRGFDFDTHEWTTGSSVAAYDTGDGEERLDLDFDAEIAAHALGDRGLAVGFEGEQSADDEDSESESEGTSDPEVARVTADGVQWRATVDGPIAAIAAAPRRAYALDRDARLVACADGSAVWTVDLPGAENRDGDRDGRRWFAVAADADAVVAATEVAVAGFAPDGERRWSRRDVDPPESLVVSDGLALVWGDRDLIAVDAANGETRWRLAGEAESLAFTADGGYRVGDDELVAFDEAGERRWSAGAGSYPESYRGRVAADAEGVYARRGRSLAAHDPADGSVRWSVEYDRISAGPFVADGGVLVAADGEMVCHYATDRF